MWNILHKAETGSTNDDALAAVRAGCAKAGDAFSASVQTKGRGRAARAWDSPKGGVYVSYVAETPAKPWHLSFISAVAVAGLAPKLKCKWPNDVMLNDRKIAGILIETEGLLAVVGIGVDIGDHAIPGSAEETLANLSELLYDKIKVYKELGFVPIRQEWLSKAWRLNENISINQQTGIFTGIDPQGFLLLDNDKIIHTGEILNL